jgi:hypothetical protein
MRKAFRFPTTAQHIDDMNNLSRHTRFIPGVVGGLSDSVRQDTLRSMYRPPTLLRTLRIAAIVCGAFWLSQQVFHFRFAEIPELHRIWAGQWGVVLTYIGAAIAMMGLFHDTKEAEQRVGLELARMSLEDQIQLLGTLQSDLNADFSHQIDGLTKRLEAIQAELIPFLAYPKTMKHIYWSAVVFLAAGATAQLMGLG